MILRIQNYSSVGACIIGLFLSGAGIVRAQGSRVTVDGNHVTIVNEKKVFPIGFTMPPPPDGKTPDGKGAFHELREAGGLFFRTGPQGKGTWNEAYLARERQYMDAAADAGMFCLPWLKELSVIEPGDTRKEEELQRIINLFKDHPGLGIWKGEDEPEWGKASIPGLQNAYRIIKETDPNHPVWIVDAPRGSLDTLRVYDNNTRDITGVDIYPISYPPGTHSLLPNKEISLVGDHAQIMMDVAEGKKPVWLTLQISWSGVVKPGRTLRMPTLAETRFMAYQSIITGARGLIFFGGHNVEAMTAEDRKVGWNWSHWNKVLRPVVEELGTNSRLQPALIAPDSKLEVRATRVGVEHAPLKGIELLVREVGSEIYLLACMREGDAQQVRFHGLPAVDESAEVMFEEPRTAKVTTATDDKGKEQHVLTDWFGPHEVHVYKLKKK